MYILNTVNSEFFRELYFRELGQTNNKGVSGNGTENFRQGRRTCLFLLFFFLEKYNFMHFERRNACQNA